MGDYDTEHAGRRRTGVHSDPAIDAWIKATAAELVICLPQLGEGGAIACASCAAAWRVLFDERRRRDGEPTDQVALSRLLRETLDVAGKQATGVGRFPGGMMYVVPAAAIMRAFALGFGDAAADAYRAVCVAVRTAQVRI